MAATEYRRFTTVGASSIASGNTSDLINTGTGLVNFGTEGQFVELSLPKSADASGTISPLSADIPLGAKITGIEWQYFVRISATTMPSTTIRTRLKLSDSNVSTNHNTITSTGLTDILTGGGDGSLHGLDIDIYNPLALNAVKFEYFLFDVTGFTSSDFNAGLGGINFGDTLAGFKGPSPAVRVHYKAVTVVVTNPTRVVLNNNKKIHIGYTSGSSFNS
jgi:hypothetical protein